MVYNLILGRNNMDLILYSMKGCPKCDILKGLMDEKEGVADFHYSICDDEEYMIENGFTSLPVVEIVEEERKMDFQEAVKYISNI